MSERVPARLLQSVVEAGRPARTGRAFTALSVTVALSGLVLGATYGDLAGGFALLGAAVLGAVLYWQGSYLVGRTVYGNLIIATFGGPALAVAVITTWLSVALDVPFLGVLASTVPSVLVNTLPVLFFLVVGLVAGLAVRVVDADLDDRVALGLLVAGLLGFAVVQVRVDQLLPDTVMLTSPMLTDATTRLLRLYALGGVVAAGGLMVALGSLADGRERLRAVLLVLLLSSVLVGAAGVGRVQYNIFQAEQAQSASQLLEVSVAELELDAEGVRLTLELTNPTDSRVTRGGAYVAVVDDGGDRLTAGPASYPGDLPDAVAPGERVTVTYRVPMTDAAVDAVERALSEGAVVVRGEQSFEVVDQEFTVEFACEWDGETCTPVG